jgi:hypothetical protein
MSLLYEHEASTLQVVGSDVSAIVKLILDIDVGPSGVVAMVLLADAAGNSGLLELCADDVLLDAA